MLFSALKTGKVQKRRFSLDKYSILKLYNQCRNTQVKDEINVL